MLLAYHTLQHLCVFLYSFFGVAGLPDPLQHHCVFLYSFGCCLLATHYSITVYSCILLGVSRLPGTLQHHCALFYSFGCCSFTTHTTASLCILFWCRWLARHMTASLFIFWVLLAYHTHYSITVYSCIRLGVSSLPHTLQHLCVFFWVLLAYHTQYSITVYSFGCCLFTGHTTASMCILVFLLGVAGLPDSLQHHCVFFWVLRKVITHSSSPWFESIRDELFIAKRDRRQAERKWRNTRLTIFKDLYGQAKHKVSKLVHTAKCKFYTDRIALASSSKELHQIVNTLSNRHPPKILPTIYPSADLPSIFIKHFTNKVEKLRANIASEHVSLTLVTGTTAATFSSF